MSYLAKTIIEKIAFVRGKGTYLYTARGVKYLDFVQGIAVKFRDMLTQNLLRQLSTI